MHGWNLTVEAATFC